jgi:exodeoxyribonuclease-5
VQLTKEQKHIIRETLKFEKNEQKLSGYAGTGKSTIVKHLAELLPNFAVCAYTGKAASVLKKKGIDRAQTIHSLIYRAYTDDKNQVRFSLSPGLDCEGIIVDEASMVSEPIYRDLKWFGKPMIFVGDHGQLEPIGDKFNLMSEPDYRLETIHRNAGEIAHFAQHIRNGYRPSGWQFKGSGDKIKFVPKGGHVPIVSKVDQVICAFNKTRAEMNILAREQFRMDPLSPCVGDRVMCLKNDKGSGLFNGMQGEIAMLYGDGEFAFESDGHAVDVHYDENTFNQVKYEFERDGPIPFDYAYAITAHRAQGSEYDSVMVLEQRCDLWDHKRWAYTAASRAKELLYWCED